MNDRELLEMAARAAGITGITRDGGIELSKDHAKPPYDWRMWNPLTDDGDALRLAVKLRLEIERSKYSEAVVYVGKVGDAKFMERLDENADIFAATRRAIVRAAAEIGRTMTTESVR